jgi:hypothetical protein
MRAMQSGIFTVRDARMADEKVDTGPADLNRWYVLFLLVLAGVGLYLWFAPDTDTVVHPVRVEAAQ